MTEAELHRSVVKWLRMLYWRVPVIWFSVPNNPRSRAAGRRLKEQGMLAGAPDLVFLWGGDIPEGEAVDPAEGYWVMPGSLLIELKRPESYKVREGKLSPAQRIFKAAAARAGVPYMIARSIVDCEAALKDRGLIR